MTTPSRNLNQYIDAVGVMLIAFLGIIATSALIWLVWALFPIIDALMGW